MHPQNLEELFGGITRTMTIVLRVFLVLSLALIVSCGNDEENSVISGMSPNQVSIGQVGAVGIISGKNLSATAVSLGDGITVTNFSLKSSSELEVHFNVSGGAVAGPRTITVTTSTGTLTGANGLNVISNKVPKAQFSISPSTGSLITVFELNGGDSSDPDADRLGYSWKLSDGTSATGRKLNHKFKSIGTFAVELTVTDIQGGTGVATKEIEVLKNSPPVVEIKVNPGVKGDTNTNFVLDGRGTHDPDGRITDYIWEFGDGTRKQRGPIAEHQYAKAGKFTLSLTAVDNKGNVATDTRELEVEKSKFIVCQGNGGGHSAIIRGTVINVEPGSWAIVDFGAGHNCGNTWHKCDDFRKWGVGPPAEFFGIVDKMVDRGNGVLAVHNACPYRWPPAKGEKVFVYFKTCRQNHCS
jgi:PKD repeat protein